MCIFSNNVSLKYKMAKTQIVERKTQLSLTTSKTTLDQRNDQVYWPKYQIKWRRDPTAVIINNCVPLEMPQFLSIFHHSLKCVAKNIFKCS